MSDFVFLLCDEFLPPGHISGGHLNPGITAAFAIVRPRSFPLYKVPFYWASQVLGGIIGGTVNYILWRTVILNYEDVNNIDRGTPESDVTASLGFGVFPFPAARELNGWPEKLISPGQALLIEAFGAGVLAFVVFMILDSRNTSLGSKDLAPVFIGLVIAAVIGTLSPLTTGCFNPARDLGPRIVGVIAGFGSRAFPGKDSGFWVYILGPLIGAPMGGALYDFVLARAYNGKMF